MPTSLHNIPPHIAELLARHWSGSETSADEITLAEWRATNTRNEATIAALFRLWRGDRAAASSPSPERIEAFVTRVREQVKREMAPPDHSRLREWAPNVAATAWWKRPMLSAVVATMFLLGIGVGTFAVHRYRTLDGGVTVQEMTTARGQRATVTLSDGTTILLAPTTHLRPSPNFGNGQREVFLDGEAYFTVAHDPGRPFIVRTVDATTTVLGTSFNVRHYSTDTTTEVAVIDGRVALASTVLSVGDVGLASKEAGVTVTRNAATSIVAWTQDRLEFDGVPLRDVVSVLERWYDVRIVLSDPRLGHRVLIATADGDSIEDIVRLIAASLNMTYDIHGKTIWFGLGNQ